MVLRIYFWIQSMAEYGGREKEPMMMGRKSIKLSLIKSRLCRAGRAGWLVVGGCHVTFPSRLFHETPPLVTVFPRTAQQSNTRRAAFFASLFTCDTIDDRKLIGGARVSAIELYRQWNTISFAFHSIISSSLFHHYHPNDPASAFINSHSNHEGLFVRRTIRLSFGGIC